MNPHLWWYVARSSGITAWVLSSAAVVWGLALSTRVAGRNPTAPWLLDLHRFLGGLSVVFVAVHLGSLLADGFTHFRVLDLVVPFASAWKPTAVAWGVVAAYLLVAVEVTSLLRRHLSVRLWRRVHLASFVLWGSATAHLVFAGTDAGSTPLLVATVATCGLVVFLTAYRVVAPRRRVARPRTPLTGAGHRPEIDPAGPWAAGGRNPSTWTASLLGPTASTSCDAGGTGTFAPRRGVPGHLPRRRKDTDDDGRSRTC